MKPLSQEEFEGLCNSIFKTALDLPIEDICLLSAYVNNNGNFKDTMLVAILSKQAIDIQALRGQVREISVILNEITAITKELVKNQSKPFNLKV